MKIGPGDRVLDLGCADTTLLIPLARRYPGVSFVGLSSDDRGLEAARECIDAAGLAVELRRGLVVAPVFSPCTFQSIVWAPLLHGSPVREKVLAIGAAYRLLKPGGTFYMIDWGAPQGLLARALFAARRFARGHTMTPPPIERLMLAVMRSTGFKPATIVHRHRTIWGTVCLFSGQRPYETCVSR
ncbi:MAG: methyltransferase domain-containing protein [Acidobacteria bacterium]|nr:methyltransferase domain-containing protein [Acidobacteriota bacterium]NIQ30669.1 methyltransferase domain-containing protein [Acidobacteriota bacterium]NIQ85627.1 methyltransferase domain-containing protein [Acidobacteriota bacterium]